MSVTMQPFNFDHFLGLSGGALVAYTDPYVNLHHQFPPAIYQDLIKHLDTFDTEHLVYVLEIGMTLQPAAFAPEAARFLSHGDSAVFTAAYRALDNMPREAVTPQLIAAIRGTPEVTLYSRHPQSGQLRLLSTNAILLSELLESLATGSRR